MHHVERGHIFYEALTTLAFVSSITRTVAMLATLGTTAVPARAQVFIAANTRPEFSIAPLFLSVSVNRALATGA